MEPTRAARKLIIFGSSPVAQSLVRIAKPVGFHVVIAAPMENHDEVAGADEYVDGFELKHLDIHPSDAIIISTQGKRDKDALRSALLSLADYVSMVGSRRKIDKLKASLVEEGSIEAERIQRLKGPAGMDIGAVGPEEIALSIAAEIVVCFRRPDAASKGAFNQELASL